MSLSKKLIKAVAVTVVTVRKIETIRQKSIKNYFQQIWPKLLQKNSIYNLTNLCVKITFFYIYVFPKFCMSQIPSSMKAIDGI